MIYRREKKKKIGFLTSLVFLLLLFSSFLSLLVLALDSAWRTEPSCPSGPLSDSSSVMGLFYCVWQLQPSFSSCHLTFLLHCRVSKWPGLVFSRVVATVSLPGSRLQFRVNSNFPTCHRFSCLRWGNCIQCKWDHSPFYRSWIRFPCIWRLPGNVITRN